MIIDTRENGQRYTLLHPLFEAAFGFLLREDLANLPPGRNEISEEHGLFAVVANESGIDETPSRLATAIFRFRRQGSHRQRKVAF